MGAKYLSKQADIEHHLLDIDNKYYTAQILLCTTKNLSVDPTNYEAMIFHYELNTVKSDLVQNYLHENQLSFFLIFNI